MDAIGFNLATAQRVVAASQLHKIIFLIGFVLLMLQIRTPFPALAQEAVCAPTLLETITVGHMPRGVAVDSERGRVYVANYGSDTISVIDSQTNSLITTLTDLPTPNQLAYDTTHNILWVTSYSTNQLIPIQANADATSFSLKPALPVGEGPEAVAYDPIGGYLYVANSLADSVTVINTAGEIPTITATLSDHFSRPVHAVANPITGRVYIANVDDQSLTVLSGGTVNQVIALENSGPLYGLAVDDKQDLLYVAAQRLLIIGPDGAQTADSVYGWATFSHGLSDQRPLAPLGAIAVNPDIGLVGEGGHLWATSLLPPVPTVENSEAHQLLLIPKGWTGDFATPLPGATLPGPAGNIAIERTTNQVYVTGSGSPGTVTVWGDHTTLCLEGSFVEANPFNVDRFSQITLAQGDVTGDGQITILDLAFIAARYHTPDLSADINGDGQVDIFDLVTTANNFGDRVR